MTVIYNLSISLCLYKHFETYQNGKPIAKGYCNNISDITSSLKNPTFRSATKD